MKNYPPLVRYKDTSKQTMWLPLFWFTRFICCFFRHWPSKHLWLATHVHSTYPITHIQIYQMLLIIVNSKYSIQLLYINKSLHTVQQFHSVTCTRHRFIILSQTDVLFRKCQLLVEHFHHNRPTPVKQKLSQLIQLSTILCSESANIRQSF